MCPPGRTALLHTCLDEELRILTQLSILSVPGVDVKSVSRAHP